MGHRERAHEQDGAYWRFRSRELAKLYAELAVAERRSKSTVHWFALEVMPGQELRAAKDLAELGFGIYLPEVKRTVIVRGRKRTSWHVMLPGYILISSILLDELGGWPRVESARGVTGVLSNNRRPVVIPQLAIDILQVEEELENGTVFGGRRGRRGYRRRARERDEAGTGEALFTIRIKSYISDAPGSSDQARRDLLLKALGLASSAPQATG